jgi:hypothetical protein
MRRHRIPRVTSWMTLGVDEPVMVELDGSSAAQDVVGGRYRLLEVIGSGGMGRVWKAEDQLLRRTVAVKEITTPTDVSTSEMLDLQLATMREARAAARLEHPGVVQVFDVVWRPGRSWIVMEYVPSRSLHDAVEQDGPLSHKQAAQVGLAVLSALTAAHQAGVLHRDVKPHNILLAEDGRVVLTDFGLATLESTETDTGKPEPLFGSPFYVAPERLKGKRSSQESDLWSLGATLYAAVEGRPPFRRQNTTQSLTALVIEPPDPQVRSGPLGPVLDGLLIKDPRQRLTAEQAEPMLRRVADRAVGVFALPDLLSQPGGQPGRRGAGRRGRIAIVTAAVLLAGAGTAAAVITHDRYTARPQAPVVSSIAAGDAAGTAVAQPIDCTIAGSGGTPVTVSAEQADYALPDGWAWHADPGGYRVAVPLGWRLVTSGATACFHDPDGERSLVVEPGSVVSGAAQAYWQQAEKASLAAGLLPGYQRVSLAAGPTGTEWEFTWQAPGQGRKHERRELMNDRAGHTFQVDWTTSQQDWPVNLPYLRLVLASIR